jgi:hypothetical protein
MEILDKKDNLWADDANDAKGILFLRVALLTIAGEVCGGGGPEIIGKHFLDITMCKPFGFLSPEFLSWQWQKLKPHPKWKSFCELSVIKFI